MGLDIPRIEPRKVDAPVDHSGGFKTFPIQPMHRRPHDIRLGMRNGDIQLCGHCGAYVKKADWRNHQEYCWYGGAGRPTWFKGAYKHSGVLRITDRQWADGDRSVRK